MRLLELHEGMFNGQYKGHEAPEHKGWRLLTPCDADVAAASHHPLVPLETLASACPMLREMGELQGSGHFDDFLALMVIVLRKARAGEPWERLMDKKQLHDVGEVIVTLSSGACETHRIWQFEKRETLVRIAWFYTGAKRVMLVTHAFVKSGGKKTPASEKTRAGGVLKQFLDAKAAGRLKLIEAQGGRNGLIQLV